MHEDDIRCNKYLRAGTGDQGIGISGIEWAGSWPAQLCRMALTDCSSGQETPSNESYLSLDELDIQIDRRILAHEHAACFKCRVPAQFEVLAIDLVVAESPMRVLPQGSLPGALGPSTAKVTGLVTPCIVRSPVTEYSPWPVRFTEVDLKVIVGYFSTSKKSGLLRCPSRWASPVLRVDTSTVASTEERVGSAVFSLSTPVVR